MPGRLTLATDAAGLSSAFPWLKVPREIMPCYNISPTQPIPVVLNDESNAITFTNWGLIPSFTNKVKMTTFLINARSEGITRKAAFRSLFKKSRCLVLADGYYEWVKIPRKRDKIPYWVHMKSRKPFMFAGLWDSWTSFDGSEVRTCCIITCEPNQLVAEIHHRMGVILPENDYAAWLTPKEMDPAELQPLLQPYPADQMTYHQVSAIVTNGRNDVPECIQPVAL